MPMVKRAIEPSDISRSQLDSEVKNELECVANNSLAFIIQQLSSLSKHSEDLFGELYAETSTLVTRTINLCVRIENLKLKIVQLNPTVEEVLLQEINLRKPFKSPAYRDQQIMVRATRPFCINEAYMNCEAPPSLNELDIFREDGKSSLKFYTDPNYFVELWYSEMKAAQHQQKKTKHKHGQIHKTSNKPKALRTPKNKIEEFKDFRHGPEFVENFRREHSFIDGSTSNGNGARDARCNNELKNNTLKYNAHDRNEFADVIGQSTKNADFEEKNSVTNTRLSSLGHHISSPRPVGPPPEPPKKQPNIPSEASQQYDNPNHLSQTSATHFQIAETDPAMQVQFLPTLNLKNHDGTLNGDNSLPPPPPSPHRLEINSLIMCQLPSPPKVVPNATDLELSPLPPPPPPLTEPSFDEILLPQTLDQKNQLSFDADEPILGNCDIGMPQPDVESLASNSSSNTCSTSATDALKSNQLTDKGPLIRDTRSDLLSAIREGIQLRKVEEHRLKSEQSKKVGPLDVQSIMEAAFEMRRKALEDNDSEDGEEDEANWSD